MYVFPAPVGALTTTSVPSRSRVTAWCCQGSGSLRVLREGSILSCYPLGYEREGRGARKGWTHWLKIGGGTAFALECDLRYNFPKLEAWLRNGEP
jgi:hypothetical protein